MPRPRPQASAQTVQVPAPVGGLNTVVSGLSLPPADCVQAYNLVAAENGLRVRMGEQEHYTGLTGTDDALVRSIHAFKGSDQVRLFSNTSSGIWNTSDTGDGGSPLFTFASASGNAGYGVSCTVVTDGGHFLLYADEENGLHRYSEVGGTWAAVSSGTGPGEIDGIDPADVVFVTTFKGRVWMVENGTGSAWYLPVGQVAGTASEFPMGTLFRHGGVLLSLFSWTYDGGSGIDDSLVARSTGGDVLVYQGTDPADPDAFGLRGVWYAGPPPAGRDNASNFGGDMLVLSRQGLVPMSKLVVGIPDARADSLTAKVANLVNVLMTERGDYRGWQIVQHPEDATLLLLCPQGVGAEEVQLAQSIASKGWFLHRGLRMTCAVAYDGRLYYGTPDGRVCVNTGYVDGVTLDDPSAYAPIQWSLITAFTDFGVPVQKQVGIIRPLILSDGVAPSFSAEARYRYDQTELGPVPLVAATAGGWDSAVWDEAVWGGGSLPTQQPRGAIGAGTAVAIAMSGAAVSRTALVGIDVTYTPGGFL